MKDKGADDYESFISLCKSLQGGNSDVLWEQLLMDADKIAIGNVCVLLLYGCVNEDHD